MILTFLLKLFVLNGLAVFLAAMATLLALGWLIDLNASKGE